MKIFHKERCQNGRRHIYFCGVKVFSYNKKNSENYYPNNCCIIPDYDNYVKRGIVFPHLIGIVIRRYATIGDNCWIYQNVTIGLKDKYNAAPTKEGSPVIGDNTTIYAGAVIVGPVKIGRNCIIGANSLVIHDVPDNAVVGGVPAKILKYQKGQ